jgi:uncharacterized protein (DUF433 family)
MAEPEKPDSAPASERIQSDPLILSGRPFVAGTRLTAEFLQGLLATGWTAEEILGVYPYLSAADLQAAQAWRP